MTCPDENRLVELVEGHLAADAQRELDLHVDTCESCRELLARFARGTTPASPADADAELVRGTTVADRYTIVDVVGAGAMSIVYAAYDRVLDRKVALKVLRDADATQATRLQREARAMAKLAHPNVVPVYDVGTLGNRMFLTAELVEGQTVAAWIAERGDRAFAEVVEVFVQAGRGLAAAHAAGITHRDFKPSNVLIGDDGRVRVADFGLARPASLEVTARDVATAVELGVDATSTKTGTLVGTPAYMAPEQLAGGTADTRSDQFSFCAALFEAVHGERPFVAASASGLLAAIESGKRTSSSTSRIDALLERGLSADPARRLPSMDAVVRELERTRSRPAKVVAGAGVLVLALLGTAAALALGGKPGELCDAAGRGIADAWNNAQHDALQARFAASGLPSAQASFARVSSLFDDYASGWSMMRVEACRATHVARTQSPALLDLRMQCLEQRRGELASLVQTLVTGDRERLARAVGAASQLSPIATCADTAALSARVAPPNDPLQRTSVSLLSAQLGRALGLERAGDYRGALASARMLADDAERLGYAPLAAEALFHRGRLEGATGDTQAAAATFQDVVRRAATAHDDALVASAWLGLVEVVGFRLARHDEGLTLARAAEASILRAGPAPKLEADLHQQRGQILRSLARFDDALAEHRKALELRRASYPAADPHISQSMHDIAEIERQQGKLELAKTDHEAALALRIEALGSDHPIVATSLMNLGHCLLALDDGAGARKHYERALAIVQAALPADHIELANAMMSLAALDLTDAKWTDAIAGLERARPIYRKALGDDHPFVGMTENNLGEAERGLGHYALAQQHFERALAIRVTHGGRELPDVAMALSNLGDVLVLQHRYADAQPLYVEALATSTKLFGDHAAETAFPRLGLAEIARARGDFATAIKLIEQAAAAQDGLDQALSERRLAELLWDHGDRARARSIASHAMDSFRATGAGEQADELAAWLASHR